MRFNPRHKGGSGGSMMAKTQKYALAFAAVGAGVFLGVQGLNFVGSKLPVAWGGYAKAAAKAAIGIAAGVASYMYAPKEIAPTLATALGAGGVYLGVSDVWSQYRATHAAGIFSLPAPRRAAVAGNAFAPRRVSA